MTRAIVSRCRIFEFKPLTDENIKQALKNAVEDNKADYIQQIKEFDYVGISDEKIDSDFQRTERQRKIINSVFVQNMDLKLTPQLKQ